MSGEAVDADSAEIPDPASGDQSDAVPVTLGVYTWKEFMREHGHGDEIEAVYADIESEPTWGSLFSLEDADGQTVPDADDWARVEFDPATYLGYRPALLRDRLRRAGHAGGEFRRAFRQWIDATPVTKDEYTWEHFKWQYYYHEDGNVPSDGRGGVRPFRPEQHLGFDPEDIEAVLAAGAESAAQLREIEDRRTVNVSPALDEDTFFSTTDGHTTLVNRYDLEKAVSMPQKRHFVEEERYWVDKPHAFVIIFHSTKENEKKYYVVEPYLNEIETDLIDFFSGKLRTSIKYSDDDVVVRGTDEDRAELLEEESKWLMDRYDLRDSEAEMPDFSVGAFLRGLASVDGSDVLDGLTNSDELAPALKQLDHEQIVTELKQLLRQLGEPDEPAVESTELDGISARPEPAVLEEDRGWLTEYQVEKVLHRIQRDFIGYERIDPIKHDINVEDISCDGYNSPAFVYHTDYENLITNVQHGTDQLDNFVIKLAQRSGKGISKRQPQVDATLPDGSRAQLTLGKEVSDHGTNYTIRQFKDVPFTPVDLINWQTFSLDEMAFLWLCIESNKSLIFAGGTASGKTTSLNAVSLFIPSNAKIVSIEDTREVELPQRNWVASVTRPSFSQDDVGDVDEFDLLEAALRQRPDYIVMGEVRGEEGRTLFQVMSTGHTTYTTFHADTVDEVLKRFTTDPINVSKTLFTALDLISVQTQTKVQGQKVRRNKTITEINSYDAENDEISVQDIFQWQPEPDQFMQQGASQKLQEIAFDRGWSRQQLDDHLFERQTILAYLIKNGLSKYTEVAATLQAFINDPETILTLIANEQLEDSLGDLREMESVLIDIDPQKEALVPRPEPGSEVLREAEQILAEAEDRIFEEYRGRQAGGLVDALSQAAPADDVTATPGGGQQILASVGDRPGDGGTPPTREDSTPTDDASRETVPDVSSTDESDASEQRDQSTPAADSGEAASTGETADTEESE
jgi:flagellar protein FlaI